MRKNPKALQRRSIIATIRILLLAAILLVVGFLLLASMLGGRFGAPHQLTLDAIGPLQSGMSRTIGGMTALWDDYVALWRVREENKQLKALLENYQLELGKYREGYRTYLYLQELLDFKESLPFEPLAARVVGKEPMYWYKTIVVDLGRQDDVLKGMIAFTPSGVVGQVIHSSEHYAKILLANAPSSAIDAMIQKNRIRGILKGAGEKGFMLRYVLKNADVQVGDHIVTAGIGGVFPAGMPLGRVARIHKKQRGMFQEIEVAPYVDFQKLEHVFIDPTDRRKIIESVNFGGGR